MTRNGAALFLAAAISLISLVAVAGSSRISGPIVFGLAGARHGVHWTDLGVAWLWAASMLVCWRLRRPD